MRDQQLGRLFRLLRARRGWRQDDAIFHAAIPRKAAQKIEAGRAAQVSVGHVRTYAGAFGLRLEWSVSGRGGDMARIGDDEHAAIVEHLAARLRSAGWTVEAEASFNHYGDRGRVDLLATRAPALLVVEVKSELTDLQDLFGALNVKRRLAGHLAAERGWSAGDVGVLLAVASTPSARRVVAGHATLFGTFAVRGPAVDRWLRAPSASCRMLMWVPAPKTGRRRWYAGRLRVRPPTPARKGSDSDPKRGPAAASDP